MTKATLQHRHEGFMGANPYPKISMEMPTTTIPTPAIKEALNALRVLWGLGGVDINLLRTSYGRRLDTRATVEEVAGDVWNRFIESRTPHEEL